MTDNRWQPGMAEPRLVNKFKTTYRQAVDTPEHLISLEAPPLDADLRRILHLAEIQKRGD